MVETMACLYTKVKNTRQDPLHLTPSWKLAQNLKS